jgi:hypothetical protein
MGQMVLKSGSQRHPELFRRRMAPFDRAIVGLAQSFWSDREAGAVNAVWEY